MHFSPQTRQSTVLNYCFETFPSGKQIQRLIPVCVAVLLLQCTLTHVHSQVLTTSGGPQTNRLVDEMQQRPMVSPLERNNLMRRPGNDQESIASLLKNVQGEDALMEVIVGRGKLITLQEPLIVKGSGQTPVVAVGDPSVLDFDILPNAQMIRILGKRVGVTDLSVVTASGKVFSFEVRVVYDMVLLKAYIQQLFPSSNVQMVQMYEHVVVEGEAASTDQSQQIIDTIRAFLTSVQVSHTGSSTRSLTPDTPSQPRPSSTPDDKSDPDEPAPLPFETPLADKPDVTATLPTPQLINLIRVPGVQQIMLQVKIAEVNRTALRKMGSSLLYRDSSGRTFGSNLGSATTDGEDLLGLVLGSATTAFAILPNTSLTAALDMLRLNSVVTVLAEPNLMAMHGQTASFLAGGQFPIPVLQGTSGGAAGGITIEYKDFGVLLDFVPYIMENGNIRLKVAPEVSTIDPSLSVTAAGGATAFALNTRRANTTVELRQGQTLAIGGLLQVELKANTSRLPGIGDLPYIGPFFSNNSHERVEKELVILVTPHFVEPMEADQVGPLPGCEIRDPDDFEFYSLNRIESRHPTNNYRATNGWDDPLHVRKQKNDPSRHGLFGVFGFSK